MQAQFIQTPCPKCGATVWISPQAGTGYCPSCHTQVAMPAQGGQAVNYGAPAPQPGAQPQAPYQAPGAPAHTFPQTPVVYKKPSILPVIGGVILMAAVGIGWAVFKGQVFGSKGSTKVKDLGIDPKAADPIKMIEKTKALAKKWKSDAEFYSINIQQLGSDGTVDLTSSNVEVVWVSPSRIDSSSSSTRKDSVKKFSFNNDVVTYKMMWGVKKPWKGFEATDVPECSTEDLAKSLKMKDGKTLHVQAWGNAYLVQLSGGPKWFSTKNCKELDGKSEGEADIGGGKDEE